MDTYIIEITGMAFSGHGIGKLPDASYAYVLGAFIGDTVEVQVYKEAEGITYAELLRITIPSPHRTELPSEAPFFDANAPWRFLSDTVENSMKHSLITELFEGSQMNVRTTPLRTTNYRNKAAYSFLKKDGTLHFALYPRGVAHSQKIIYRGNILVNENINSLSSVFLNFLNQKNVPLETLKYLTIRYSYYTDSMVAEILVTESSRKKLAWKKSELIALMNQHTQLQGIIVAQSSPHVRTADVVKEFYSIGTTDVQEKLGSRMYTYHPSQFFQIYPAAFQQILDDCEQYISSIENHIDYRLLDLFAGVGVIGIHLTPYVKSVHAVERSPLSKKYAEMNAKGIQNFSHTEAHVDEICDYIQHEQILVLDPPRSGCSRTILEKINDVQPQHIIYISCNPETQKRDFDTISNHYKMKGAKMYNLFPNTPHIEHVLYLERR